MCIANNRMCNNIGEGHPKTLNRSDMGNTCSFIVKPGNWVTWTHIALIFCSLGFEILPIFVCYDETEKTNKFIQMEIGEFSSCEWIPRGFSSSALTEIGNSKWRRLTALWYNVLDLMNCEDDFAGVVLHMFTCQYRWKFSLRNLKFIFIVAANFQIISKSVYSTSLPKISSTSLINGFTRRRWRPRPSNDAFG